MNQKHSRQSYEMLIAVIILLIGGITRLYQPGISEFKLDEANLSQLALDVATGETFHLLGIGTSAGIPNTPVSVYLYAIPYFFDPTPYLATVVIGLVNLLAVALTWRLVRSTFGLFPAIVATLLYACSPWAGVYTRKLWANFWLPPFVVASMLTGFYGFRKGNSHAQLWHIPLVSLTAQIHYSGVFILPLTGLFILFWRNHIRWKFVLFGVLITFLTLLPFSIGLVQTNTISSIAETTEVSPPDDDNPNGQVSVTSLQYAWLLASGQQIHSLAGNETYQEYLQRYPSIFPIYGAIPILSFIALIGLSIIRGPTVTWKADSILWGWLLIPILALTLVEWQGTPIFLHYMIPLIPVPFIVVGVGLDRFSSYLGNSMLFRRIALGFITFLGLSQIIVTTGLFKFVDEHATPGAFGTPLHYLLGARTTVLEHHPSQILLVADGQYPSLLEHTAVWRLLFEDVPVVRPVDGTNTLLLPVEESYSFVDFSDALVSGPAGTYWVQGDPLQFPRRDGENPYLYNLQTQLPPIEPLVEPVQFANGVQILSFDLSSTHPYITFQLTAPAEVDYFVSIQGYDADGNRVYQADRVIYPSQFWKVDDKLIAWFDSPVPDSTRSTLIIIYWIAEDGSIITVDVLDNSNSPIAPWLEVPSVP